MGRVPCQSLENRLPVTTTYAREPAFRNWWLRRHQGVPLIQAYEELAQKYQCGLAELPPLPVELSGEVQEVIAQRRTE
jgi:hypothetical protein